MSIWYGEITLDLLNGLSKGTLGEAFNIRVTEIGEDYLKATMPFSNATRQPFGLLHGGASVALAETLGSIASWCCINRESFIGVGIEINANHLAAVTQGSVTAVCSPIRVKGKLHVWEIKIYDDLHQLTCISRFTCMVIPKRL